MANAKDVIELVGKKAGLTKAGAERATTAVFDAIKELSEEGDLKIRGLGKFFRKRTEARERRNPQTNEMAMAPAKTVLAFKCESTLVVKEALPEAPAKKKK